MANIYYGATSAIKYYPINLIITCSLGSFAHIKNIKPNETEIPLLFATTIGPIIEEGLFRGGIQNGLDRALSIVLPGNDHKLSSLVCSILFASSHIISRKSSIQYLQAINTFFISYFLFSKTYNSYGLSGSISAHITSNLLIRLTDKIYSLLKRSILSKQQ